MIRRNLDGPYAEGVDNPYTAHVHPYPTRYHGGIYTRPVFGLPYVRTPHAVFKPDDFYSYYGVKGLGGLGSFGGSSLGNGTLGGNTLGLGATGEPIYYLASKTNSKVSMLQGGINKVLVANRYKEIPVTGKLDALTCAAAGLCAGLYKSELLTQVPEEIVREAADTCMAAQKSASIVKTQIEDFARMLDANRAPPPKPFESPGEVVPSNNAATVPNTQQQASANTTPVHEPVIEQAEQLIAPPPTTLELEFPDMEIEAVVPPQDHSKTNMMLIGIGVLAAAGVGYLLLKK